MFTSIFCCPLRDMQMPKNKAYIYIFSLFFLLATASVEQGKPILQL